MAVKAKATITLVRVDDGKDGTLVSATPPEDKTKAWLDISVKPPVLKRWDGSKWEIVNDVQVGGRNLILNSNDKAFTIAGEPILMVDRNYHLWDGSTKGYKISQKDYFKKHTDLQSTFSFRVIDGNTTAALLYRLVIMTDAAGANEFSPKQDIFVDEKNEERIVIIFDNKEVADRFQSYTGDLYFRIKNTTNAVITTTLCDLRKLELGNNRKTFFNQPPEIDPTQKYIKSYDVVDNYIFEKNSYYTFTADLEIDNSSSESAYAAKKIEAVLYLEYVTENNDARLFSKYSVFLNTEESIREIKSTSFTIPDEVIRGLIDAYVIIARPDLALDAPDTISSAVNWVKLESGNKATDWTPAPEDTEDEITKTKVFLHTLEDRISTLVIGPDGSSQMTQTEDGWRFDISSILNDINKTKDDVETQNGKIDGIDRELTELSELGAYIVIKRDQGDPIIELGNNSIDNNDDQFKVRISNKSIDFMKNDEKIAWIDGEQLQIRYANVQDELKFGGFTFTERVNGNMGLIWKGE